MKILYILEDGRFGGMNKMISEIASETKKRGIDVQLIVGTYDADFFCDMLSNMQLPYTPVNLQVLSKKPINFFKYFISFIPDIIKLITAINRLKPDLVYTNGSQQVKGAIAASLLWRPIIWHLHDTFQPKPLVHAFTIIRHICSVQNYIASSQKTVQFYNLPKLKTLVSRPPLILENFTYRNPIEKKEKVFKVITVCNINPDKGLEILIKAISEINKRYSKVHFVVVGMIPETQKTYYQSLLDLTAQLNVRNIDFIGQRSDIHKLLSESDLYLCTSNNESGPLSVFEAMAIGLPVVSTDVGDLKPLFEKYQCGIIKPVGDSWGLAASVTSILDNPETSSQFIANARLAVEENNNISLCVERQIKFFREILKHEESTTN